MKINPATGVETSQVSKKYCREKVQQFYHIRPAKVLKASGSSTSGERAEDVNADLDEAISKCFIGNLMIIMHDDE